MRILLIEDEDSIRAALVRALERDGHQVRAAASIVEGRAQLSGWAPEMAVSDLKLPDGDGLDLLSTIGVPFVMISGYATYDDAVRALRCGAVDFFTKPVAIKDIRAAIARFSPRPLAGHDLTWTDRAAARAQVQPALRSLHGRIARLAVSELAQMTESGRLEIHADDRGVRVWLDAQIQATDQRDRLAWLRAHGVAVQGDGHGLLVRIQPELPSEGGDDVELLWPEELMSGKVIRSSAWGMVGSWFLAAVRAGVGPFSGLSAGIIAACAACEVVVSVAPADLSQPGVGGGERADLLADPELGAPLA